MNKEPGGLRYDEGKLEWHLLPMHLLGGMIRVLMRGKIKYAEHNWRKGHKYSRITNSLQRHLNAFQSGEDVDPETGLPHVDHILCNALFLSGAIREHPELDDRFRHDRIDPSTIPVPGLRGNNPYLDDPNE